MNNQNEKEAARRPVHETRFGSSRVAIWQNEKGFHSITSSRLYKGEDGKWCDSGSFDRTDIPHLIRVLEEAYTWLYSPDAKPSEKA